MRPYMIKTYRGTLAMVWRDGKGTRRLSLRTTDPDEAAKLAAEIADDTQRAEASSYTVAQIWDAYRATLASKPTYVTMGYEARAILPAFGDKLPNRLTESMVKAYIAGRRKAGLRPGRGGVKDGTIRTELTRLGCALRFAVKRGWIAQAPELFLPAQAPPRDRHLSREEARRFLDAIALPHARLFVILALSTGARSEALLSLTWNRVDMDRRRIQLADLGETRRMKGRALVPINATAHAALAEAKATAGSPFVLTYKGRRLRSVRTAFRTAAAASGVESVTPHVFRHTAAVWMAEARVPMQEIAQFLGHADYKVTEKVYARYSPDFLQGAAQALDF